MIKILHIIGSLGYQGGAQPIFLDFLKKSKSEYSDVNHNIIILSSNNFDQYIQTLNENNFNYQIILKKDNIIGFLTLPFILFKVMKKQDYDVLQLHLKTANLLGTILSLFPPKRPVISTVYIAKSQRPLQFSFYRLQSFCVYKFINIIEKEGLQKIGIPRKKVEFLPMAVNLENSLKHDNGFYKNKIYNDYNITGNKKILLCVSRLHRSKNPILIIETVRHLKTLNRDFILLMVGDGPLRGKIEKSIKHEDLDEFVIMTGAKKNIHEYYAGCDLYIAQCVYNMIGIAAIQAMSMSKSVLGINMDKMKKDYIISKHPGYYYIARSPEIFAVIINKFIGNEKYNEKFAKKAGEKLIKDNNINLQNYVTKQIEIYRELAPAKN